MDFLEATPVAFKEIAPIPNIPEKWKEVVLNTGGTHSTLQDIKIPQKGGGYWYNDCKKSCTRNRFIYWRTTADAIELSEASLDIHLTGANLRCKVAPGTPPLSTITVHEHPTTQHVFILAATVSSVHRLIFPHPVILDKKPTFGSLSSSSPSIFHDTSSLNIHNNYHILNQYSNSTLGVAHTCTSLLRENGEAVFALAFGQGGEGALLIVKLPITGSAVTTLLKRESTMPRFLSGITGALRGKSAGDGVETYGVVLTKGLAIAVCGDTCLRAWTLDEGGAPITVTAPLSQALVRPKPPPHGHMLQKTLASNGSVILVAYLSFPAECEFVVMKMHDGGVGGVRFSHISRIYGPQLDLLDYTIGHGDGSNVIWALWSRPDGDTIITSSAVGAEAGWRVSRGPDAPAQLPFMATNTQYRDRLLQPGLFPQAVLRKALIIYNRTWGGNDTSVEGDLGECAVNAVQSRLRHLSARTANADHAHLMHKCWSDLYSWCMQYMEGLQKPLGLMVSNAECESEIGWWCAVIRRAGISLVCELEPLERMMLSPEESYLETATGGEGGDSNEGVSGGGRVVALGAAWERRVGVAGAHELERRVFASPAPHHRLLPRLLHLLNANTDKNDAAIPTLSPQQIEELAAIVEPIKDLQSAVLELNDALRLDVPEIDTTNTDNNDTGEYDSLFASELGVAVVTEAIRQMAEMRCRVVRGAAAALGACVGGAGGGVPGGGHCGVHWQAYRALLWLRTAPLQQGSSGSSEAFRLKLSVLGAEPSELDVGVANVGGVVGAYAAGAGGSRTRAHLRVARANTLWPHALPLFTYHLAHQLWAVSGGFEFGWWLATINQPRLVHNYVNMLEPWCEWNACSRQFILGLALLDMEDPAAAYGAFCKAAKGVATEPFLRRLVAAPDARLTHHQALVLYYMKVIKLFEIHDAGAWVVRLAETAISIADKDDPNLAMFQWLVFKWHLSGGRTERALAAAAANPAPNARAAAAAALLTTLGARRELGALVSCGALAPEAERAAAARAKLHDAHTHNPYYDFLYALHISRHHYRKEEEEEKQTPSSEEASNATVKIAAAVMYERAARCGLERAPGASGARRRWLAAALVCLRLAQPEHAFLARPKHADKQLQVIGPDDLAAELREEDPESLDGVQRALKRGENINFDSLYQKLKDADPVTLLAVTKRAISAGQFLPRWFLTRYMEVDGAGCVRALLMGGRVAEAGCLCAEALRGALLRLRPTPPVPLAAPLGLADLLLNEMQAHLQTPYMAQIHKELKNLVKEYTQLVIRTSEDMKLAYVKHVAIH